MTQIPLESTAIARVAEDYRNRGYKVEVEPRKAAIPEFLGDFQPDIIARRENDSVVVEVKVGTRDSAAERFREIVDRVNRHAGWRFSLVFVNPDEPDRLTEAEPVPLSLVEQRMQNSEKLLQESQFEAAFLLMWSALEGVRRILGDRAGLPLASLPPSALIRELYSAGEIAREPFESLTHLLPVRNRLVHGFGLKEAVDVEQLRQLVNALMSEASAP